MRFARLRIPGSNPPSSRPVGTLGPPYGEKRLAIRGEGDPHVPFREARVGPRQSARLDIPEPNPATLLEAAASAAREELAVGREGERGDPIPTGSEQGLLQ